MDDTKSDVEYSRPRLSVWQMLVAHSQLTEELITFVQQVGLTSFFATCCAASWKTLE